MVKVFGVAMLSGTTDLDTSSTKKGKIITLFEPYIKSIYLEVLVK